MDLKNLPKINKYPARIIRSETIINCQISVGIFIYFYPNAQTCSRLDIYKFISWPLRHTFQIGEKHPSQQSILSQAKTVFHLLVQQISTSVPALYISPSQIMIGVPCRTRQIEVRHLPVGQPYV